MASECAVWLIDGHLVYKAAKEAGQFIQFKQLRDLIEREFRIPLRVVMYFDSAPRTDSDRKRHNYLSREVGFRIKAYELGRKSFTCPSCEDEFQTRPQKCVDIALAMSIMEYATKRDPVSYNPLVLSTGDRDFLPVLEKVRDEYDKDVVLVAPKKSTAAELYPVTTRQIWIEDHYSSVATPWIPRAWPRAQEQAAEEEKGQEVISTEEALNDGKALIQRVWQELQPYETSFPNGRKGRPWGFVLNNFGRTAVREGKKENLQALLVEKDDGQWKGANRPCLELARQMWPGSEIATNEQGHPYLVVSA